jgi:hypothetical protein
MPGLPSRVPNFLGRLWSNLDPQPNHINDLARPRPDKYAPRPRTQVCPRQVDPLRPGEHAFQVGGKFLCRHGFVYLGETGRQPITRCSTRPFTSPTLTHPCAWRSHSATTTVRGLPWSTSTALSVGALVMGRNGIVRPDMGFGISLSAALAEPVLATVSNGSHTGHWG